MIATRTPLEILSGAAQMDLPETGRLSDQQRRGVLHQVNELVAADGTLSHVAVARMIGCSAATWSLVRRGSYRGEIDRYIRKAAQWLADRATRAVQPAGDYVDTRDGRMIHAVCHRAVSSQCIGKIVLESGCGKTAALAEYARRRGDRAVLMRCGEAASSRGGFLIALARALGIRGYASREGSHLTAARTFESIRQHLANLYGGGANAPLLLLVDEATTLHPGAINMLRNLHDDPDVRLAVVLADTARMEDALHSRRGIAGGNEQLSSRFGAVYAPPACVPDGAHGSKPRELPLDDVRAVAQSIVDGLGGGRLHADAVRYLHRLAQRPGRLRNVEWRIRTAHDYAESAGGEARYTVAELDFVAELVGQQAEIVHDASPFEATTPRESRVA
jgi:DNA transposition AAA+ family ATPase